MRSRWLLAAAAAPAMVAGCGGTGPARSTVRSSRTASSSRMIVRASQDLKVAGELMFVDVTIRSHPDLFLVDTGASRTVVATPVAKVLRLPSEGPARRVSTLGCSTVDRPVRISDWRIGGRALAPLTAVSQALQRFTVNGLRLSGVLGTDFLARFGIATVDFAHRQLILGGPAPTSGQTVATKQLALRPAAHQGTRGDFLLMIGATVHQSTGKWVVDTGSSTVVIAARHAAALGLPVIGLAAFGQVTFDFAKHRIVLGDAPPKQHTSTS